jgi:hypothetical protein
MMRLLIGAAITALMISEASPQATLLGNCGVGKITGILVKSDLSIDVYCDTPPSSACPAGGTDFSLVSGCNLQFYLRGVFP